MFENTCWNLFSKYVNFWSFSNRLVQLYFSILSQLTVYSEKVNFKRWSGVSLPFEKYFFFKIFFGPQVEVEEVPPLPWDLQYYTMILQLPRIIVGDAGFEPGTSAPEVWCTTNWATTSLLKILQSNIKNVLVDLQKGGMIYTKITYLNICCN